MASSVINTNYELQTQVNGIDETTPKCVRLYKAESGSTTYTFEGAYPFVVIVTRRNGTSSSPDGFYIGQAYAGYGNIYAVKSSANATVEISGTTLTITTTTTSMNIVIMYMPTFTSV